MLEMDRSDLLCRWRAVLSKPHAVEDVPGLGADIASQNIGHDRSPYKRLFKNVTCRMVYRRYRKRQDRDEGIHFTGQARSGLQISRPGSVEDLNSASTQTRHLYCSPKDRKTWSYPERSVCSFPVCRSTLVSNK